MWSVCLASIQSQHCRKWGVVCKSIIPALWRKRLEAGIRGNFWLCCKLETSLGYRRPCLKRENCFLCLNIFCMCKNFIVSHIRKKHFIFRKNTYYLMLKNVIQRSYKAAQPVKVLATTWAGTREPHGKEIAKSL